MGRRGIESGGRGRNGTECVGEVAMADSAPDGFLGAVNIPGLPHKLCSLFQYYQYTYYCNYCFSLVFDILILGLFQGYDYVLSLILASSLYLYIKAQIIGKKYLFPVC